MTPQAEYVRTTDTVARAALAMADLDVGAVPVCDPDGRLAGILTDRDITVKVVAADKDPRAVPLSDVVVQPEVITVAADDSIDDVLATMKQHRVRRLPVVEGNQVVGIVAQADLARQAPAEQVGDLVAAISD